MDFIKLIPTDEFKFIKEEYSTGYEEEKTITPIKKKPTLKIEDIENYKKYNYHRDAYRISNVYKVVLDIPNFAKLYEENKHTEAKNIIKELNKRLLEYPITIDDSRIDIDYNKLEKLINEKINMMSSNIENIFESKLTVKSLRFYMFTNTIISHNLGYVYVKNEKINIEPDTKTIERRNKKETEKKLFNTFCSANLTNILKKYGLAKDENKIYISNNSPIISKVIEDYIKKCFEELSNIGITIDSKLKDNINFKVTTENTRGNTVGNINYKFNFKENKI